MNVSLDISAESLPHDALKNVHLPLGDIQVPVGEMDADPGGDDRLFHPKARSRALCGDRHRPRPLLLLDGPAAAPNARRTACSLVKLGICTTAWGPIGTGLSSPRKRGCYYSN